MIDMVEVSDYDPVAKDIVVFEILFYFALYISVDELWLAFNGIALPVYLFSAYDVIVFENIPP